MQHCYSSMRLSRKSLIVIVVVLPAALASCSTHISTAPDTTTTAAVTTTTLGPALTTTTSKSGLVPALYAPDPKVTVTPSRNLMNGQKVIVSVTGFDSGGKFFISECASASDASSAGCGPGLPFQPFGVINNSKGIGSYPFTVSTAAAARPEGKATVQCTDQCVIVATVGLGYGFAFAPIEFAKG